MEPISKIEAYKALGKPISSSTRLLLILIIILFMIIIVVIFLIATGYIKVSNPTSTATQ